ncbi:hypothetical protein [Sporosarcina sp. FSL K6-3457]|uniref:hypothetical protein n=1 Tax=Sporosarcina sp. FSL K6-3457 TaxID=2978204 RepID=UPI0030FC26B9
MEELLKQFMGQMDSRFEQMEKRMDVRFEEMEKRMDARFEEMEERMDARFDQVDKRFDKVELDMANNQTENRSHFRHIEERLDKQEQTFEVVAEEIKGIKIDINYLNQKVAKHDMEINNLHQRLSI